MLFAADKGDINTIIGGIAPDWGPFGSLGNEAKVMIEVVMAVAILLCLGIAIWGAAKQRIGATALRDTFSAEQGKGLIIAAISQESSSSAPSARCSPSCTAWPCSPGTVRPAGHARLLSIPPARRAHRLRLRFPDVESPHRARAGTSTATVVRGV